MKKILILLLISFASYAQIQKGSFSVGTGAISFERQAQSKDVYGNTFTLNPGVGYLLSNHFEVGFSALCNLYNGREVTLKSNSNYALFMPYATYYFGKERFQPFVGIRGGLVTGQNKYTNRTLNITGYVGELNAGGNYFLTDNIALGLNAGYRYLKQEENYDKNITSVNRTNSNLYIGFNFTFYFPPKK